MGKVSSETSGDGLMRDYNHEAFLANRGFNPAFLARQREKQKKRKLEQLAQEKEARKSAVVRPVEMPPPPEPTPLFRYTQEKLAEIKRNEASKAEAIAAERVKEIKSGISAEIRFSKMIAEISMRVNGQNKIRVEDIIPIVAEKHRVTVADIKGACRSKKVIAARFEAIAEARRLRPDLSLTQLGRLFGKRDHTTIRHALVKMGMPTASIEGQKIYEITRRAA